VDTFKAELVNKGKLKRSLSDLMKEEEAAEE